MHIVIITPKEVRASGTEKSGKKGGKIPLTMRTFFSLYYQCTVYYMISYVL